jgi:hypothetical protein
MQHNKVIHIVLYFIIYLGGKQAYSQSVYARVEGKVIDNAGKGISNSKISLISLTDTSVYYCTSETDGKFSIYSIKSYGRYLITVDHIGFAKFVKVIDFTSQYNNIGKLIMIDSAVFMQEIIISNKRKAFIKNKDTIEYDAKYFKTNADMDAIYLLNKMPGFDISGKIKIDGDSAKVAINGILYFGDDPRKILGLIPAGVIEKIQVYNDSTKDGTTANFFERNKIINIVTKKNYFSVPKGKVYGGLGHNLFYLLGGNVFLQNEKLQISANGAINKGQIPFNKSFDATSQFESSGIPIAKDFNANLKYQLSKKTTFSFYY